VAVKIKLKRLGKMRSPQYRIVVADARAKRDGRAIEEIGVYQPKQQPSLIRVNSERAQYWLGVGAQPTEPVLAILKVTGDWQKFHGLPGAEGTLRFAEPKADKVAAFAAAAKEAAAEPTTEAVTPRPKRAKAPATEAAAPVEAAAEPIAEAAAEPTTEAAAEPAAEAAGEPIAEAAAEPTTEPATEPERA